MGKNFNDDDFFENKNRTIKSYLIETFELQLKYAIENENYEDAIKIKKKLDKLNENNNIK